jgi:hypothetical protein
MLREILPGASRGLTASDCANRPQKLQRRIANSRGIAPDASLVSPTQSTAEELKLQDAAKVESAAPDGRETVGVVVTKRKYRRHPKVSSWLWRSSPVII